MHHLLRTLIKRQGVISLTLIFPLLCLLLLVQCKPLPKEPLTPGHEDPSNPIIPPNKPNDPQPKPLTVDYVLDPCEELLLKTKAKGTSYQWSYAQYKNGEEHEAKYTLFSEEETPYFFVSESGFYKILAKVKTSGRVIEESYIIEVRSSNFKHSPYITQVFDFTPAPGQFVNEAPKWVEGMTYKELLDVVLKRLGGTNKNYVSLGAYGGSITFGFDHIVPNLDGPDLVIWGNAFPKSSEAGIVQVAYDANHNGIPDDPWYELYGSAHKEPDATFHYSITYYRPDSKKQPVLDPKEPSVIDAEYIRWEDNQGNSGFIPQNKYHKQSYYPAWIKEDSYTLSGTRLKNNAVLTTKGESKIWELNPFEWGYVDNKPNNDPNGSQFDLSHARDSKGNPVALKGIHFVKVYTALNQVAGVIGETSTEVMHAYDIRYRKLLEKR